MTTNGSEPGAGLVSLGSESLVALGTAALEYLHPGSSVVLTSAGPAAMYVARLYARRLLRIRELVSERGQDFDALVETCEGSAEKEQLVVRVLEAARIAGTETHLKMLALSFVRAATSKSAFEVGFETTLVRTVGELEDAHLRVLRLFTMSEFELFGITLQPSGEPVDRPPLSLMRLQIVQQLVKQADGSEPPEEVVAAVNEVVDGVIAELVARGLIGQSLISGGNAAGGGGSGWSLTPFGAALADRLALVAQAADRAPPP